MKIHIKKSCLCLLGAIAIGLSIVVEPVMAIETEQFQETPTEKVVETPIPLVEELPEEKVEVQTIALGNGEFKIEITGIDLVGDFKNVYVPIWKNADQSDMVWYVAEKKENKSYVVCGNIENHKYNTGTYNVHIYGETQSGEMKYIADSRMNINDMTFGDFYDVSQEGYHRLILENVEDQGIASKIQFAVWSDTKGQDDLYWYDAIKEGDSYFVDVQFFNHKDIGDYIAHAYIVRKDGGMAYVKSLDFAVDEFPSEKIEVTGMDSRNGSFEVTFCLNRNASDIKKVYLAAWQRGDQSDMHWYEAKRQSDGSYKVTADVKQHKYHLGNYILHGYVEDKHGKMIFVDSTDCMVELSSGEFTSNLNSNGYSMQLSLSNVQEQGIAKKMYFAVWSAKNGQDDVCWYEASINGNTYTSNMMFYNHKDTGIYYAHAYVSGKDGQMHLLKTMDFEVETIPEEKIEVVRMDNSKGLFDVELYVNRPENVVKRVYLAVWSKSDQRDMHWYEAKKRSDGSYLVNVDLSMHKYNTGTYYLHGYIEDAQGKKTFFDSETCSMVFSVGDFTAEENGNEYSRRLTLTDVQTQGVVDTVYFAVWSAEKGQDDAHWYEATVDGTNYISDMFLYYHKNAGVYYAHVYCKNRNGQMTFLKSLTFDFGELEMPQESVFVSNIDESNGTFDVKLNLFRAEEAIKRVYVPVWTKPDQSDINWYVAERQSDGSYYVKVDAMKHQWNSGEYKVHSYVESMDGKMNFVSSESVRLTLGTRIVTQTLDEYSTRVKIYGADARASKVYFPTWSLINGQDDVKWYEGQKNEDTSWSTTVHTREHVNAGDFVSHIYVDVKGDLNLVGDVSFNIERKWEGRWIDPNKPMVALTFDDGPSNYTPRILNSLEANGQAATFFVVGYNAARYGSTMKRMIDMGCEIGNHSYNHPDLTTLSYSGIVNEMSATNTHIFSATGTYATVSRTPGGSVNSTVRSAISTPIIMWSIDTLDWKTRDTWSTVNSVLNNVQDGDIVLMHDIHSPTIAAAEILIPELVKRGYQLVTVSELAKYRGNGMNAGQVYYNFR